jgi:cobyrinic acid a,c-diamide synthase
MVPSLNIPRVVIAATGSGAGKTTVTVAILAALRARGMRVAAFKCGPDYLDPTYHARVLGAPSQNLDAWMMGREAVLATLARAAAGADIAVIEGMMALFDGVAPDRDEGSTAEIAKWLDAPVVLVLDASGIARTVGAIAAGFIRFDPALRLGGLLCNRVGGRGHLGLLRAARPESPIVGGLPDSTELAFPERHLGLFSADRGNVPDAVFDGWARLAADWIDLDAIVALARSAPRLAVESTASTVTSPPRQRARIGIAYDDAFHFYYEDNLRRLEDAGAELVRFSPVHDAKLPDVDGLYFGGGYPEAHAAALSGNAAVLGALRRLARAGAPIYAECGGLMYLCEGIRTLDGRVWPMAGLVPGIAAMNDRLQAIGYVEVESRGATIFGPAGMRLRGHQFRYSTMEPTADSARVTRVYTVTPRWGGGAFEEGYAAASVLASYVHTHWASNPAPPAGFVESCARARQTRK